MERWMVDRYMDGWANDGKIGRWMDGCKFKASYYRAISLPAKE